MKYNIGQMVSPAPPCGAHLEGTIFSDNNSELYWEMITIFWPTLHNILWIQRNGTHLELIG